MEDKRNLNRKLHLLQNNQNADTTLMHSFDDVENSPTLEPRQVVCNRVKGDNQNADTTLLHSLDDVENSPTLEATGAQTGSICNRVSRGNTKGNKNLSLKKCHLVCTVAVGDVRGIFKLGFKEKIT